MKTKIDSVDKFNNNDKSVYFFRLIKVLFIAAILPLLSNCAANNRNVLTDIQKNGAESNPSAGSQSATSAAPTVATNSIAAINSNINSSRISKPKRIFLEYFSNSTFKPKINEILTESIFDALCAADDIEMVDKPENADYLIKGNIVDYKIETQMRDYHDAAQMNKLLLTLKVSLIDNRRGLMMNTATDSDAPKSSESATADNFEFTVSTIFTETGINAETEITAFERLKTQAALRIYNRVRNTGVKNGR